MADDLTTIDPDWAWSPFEPRRAVVSEPAPGRGTTLPWNRRTAAHLLRRAGFGATPIELDRALEQTPGEVVTQLLSAAQTAAGEDVNDDQLAQAMLATGNSRNLAAWWLHRMMHAASPLHEKLTLFWHGHFATSAEKVTDARLMFAQNRLLREHAVGDFGQMTHAIARDPAMLIYLDSATNRKAHPNENFARELMELFCLGEGQYSEHDIQELARCFTGWEVKLTAFRFNRYQHDDGEKSILGQVGRFSGEQGVQVVLDEAAAPRFIVRKLIRFFVSDEPDAPDRLVEPLAAQFRAGGLHIRPVLETMLGSNLFFSNLAIARRVRSPIELVVGLVRTLAATVSVPPLADSLHQLGHSAFYPANVKGWDGGRAWINTSTILGRANVVSELLSSSRTRFAGGDLATLLRTWDAGEPATAIERLAEILLAVPLSDDLRQRLLTLHDDLPGNADERARGLLRAISLQPEFHLC